MISVHPPLKAIVQVVRGVAGGTCAQSPHQIEESVPMPNGKSENITGIAQVLDGGRTIGWIYRTESNRFFVQAAGNLELKEQRKLTGNVRSLESGAAIVPITNAPRGLHVMTCTARTIRKPTR